MVPSWASGDQTWSRARCASISPITARRRDRYSLTGTGKRTLWSTLSHAGSASL